MCRFIYQNVQNSILRIFHNEDDLHDLFKKKLFEKKRFIENSVSFFHFSDKL